MVVPYTQYRPQTTVKMQEILNPFHIQNYLISRGFSNDRETDFVFLGNFDAV